MDKAHMCFSGGWMDVDGRGLSWGELTALATARNAKRRNMYMLLVSRCPERHARRGECAHKSGSELVCAHCLPAMTECAIALYLDATETILRFADCETDNGQLGAGSEGMGQVRSINTSFFRLFTLGIPIFHRPPK